MDGYEPTDEETQLVAEFNQRERELRLCLALEILTIVWLLSGYIR